MWNSDGSCCRCDNRLRATIIGVGNAANDGCVKPETVVTMAVRDGWTPTVAAPQTPAYDAELPRLSQPRDKFQKNLALRSPFH